MNWKKPFRKSCLEKTLKTKVKLREPFRKLEYIKTTKKN